MFDATQRYVPIEPNGSIFLGKGAYGTVYLGLDQRTGQRVALKKIREEGDPSHGIGASTMREIMALKCLAHENVITLLDLMQGHGRVVLVLEYVDCDLHMFMKDFHGALPENMVQHFIHQILLGLTHCHRQGFMHRDIKPSNILVRLPPSRPVDVNEPHAVDGYRLKIADFGLSRTVNLSSRQLTNDVVTLWYRAPELLLGSQHYDTSVDIWSAGCIFCEMANPRKKPLFDSSHGVLDHMIIVFRLLGTPVPAEADIRAEDLGLQQLEPAALVEDLVWPGVDRLAHWSPNFPKWPPLAWSVIAPLLSPSGHQLAAAMLRFVPSQRVTAADAQHFPYITGETGLADDHLDGPMSPEAVENDHASADARFSATTTVASMTPDDDPLGEGLALSQQAAVYANAAAAMKEAEEASTNSASTSVSASSSTFANSIAAEPILMVSGVKRRRGSQSGSEPVRPCDEPLSAASSGPGSQERASRSTRNSLSRTTTAQSTSSSSALEVAAALLQADADCTSVGSQRRRSRRLSQQSQLEDGCEEGVNSVSFV